MKEISVTFEVNGEVTTLETMPNKRLLDALRDDLKLLSVKEGCGEGECGACTVLLDDMPVTSCTMLVGQADGRRITTLEGLSKDGEPDRLQNAFVEVGAVQCGYCTPGMILAGKSLLMRNPNPSREEIKRALSGNLCRCTGYTKIIEAVEKAAAS